MQKREGKLCMSCVVSDSVMGNCGTTCLWAYLCVMQLPVWHACLSVTRLPECALLPGPLHAWSLILVKPDEVDAIIMPILQTRNSICPRVHTDEELNLPQGTQLLNETISIFTSQKKERRRHGDCDLRDPSSSSHSATTYLGDLGQLTPVLFHPLQIKGSLLPYGFGSFLALHSMSSSEVCIIICDYL